MAFYDQLFSSEPTRLGIILNRRIAMAHWAKISSFVPENPRVVEIGPGRGEFADICMEKGMSYTGVDASPMVCDRIREKGGKVIQDVVPPLPVESESAEVVYASSVIEHMPNHVRALELLTEMARVATPDGVVVVSAPDVLAAGVHFWNSEYTHGFPTSRRRLLQMCQDVGLQVRCADYFAGPFTGCRRVLLDAISRAVPTWLGSVCSFGLISAERFYKTRTALMRCVFLIAGKGPQQAPPPYGRERAV